MEHFYLKLDNFLHHMFEASLYGVALAVIVYGFPILLGGR